MLITAETVRPAGSIACHRSRVRRQVMEGADAEYWASTCRSSRRASATWSLRPGRGYFHQTVYEPARRLMNSL